MKLKIKQSILMEHLNYVSKGLSNKNIIPALNCIKLDLTDEGLYLISTDNEIVIKTFISKNEIEEIQKLGTIVISGRLLCEITRKLSSQIINIEEFIDNNISISTETSQFNLNCINSSEFPEVDLSDSDNNIKISKKTFKNIVNQTIFATSNQESRPVLTGIDFKFENDKLTATATDSYRLARKVVSINSNINKEIIIPTRNLNELIRMFQDDEEDLEIHIFDNRIIFKFNSIIMLSRIINGVYPDTTKIIPETFKINMKVNLRELSNAIDRASLLTNENEKNTIKFQSLNCTAVISSNIPEIGHVEENIKIISDYNEKFCIAFSSKYMLDALKSFDCEEVELLFNSDVKPIIIKNPNSEGSTQLILPIRTY